MSLSSARKWFRLPSRIALLLGLGALSAAGAKADIPDAPNEPVRVPQQSAKSFGDLRIWGQAGGIWVSEPGKETQQLHLRDTAEARHLREMLERNGAVADSPHVLPHRMILVGGGGKGVSSGYWQRVERPGPANGASKTGGSTKATHASNPNRAGQGSGTSKTNTAGSGEQR